MVWAGQNNARAHFLRAQQMHHPNPSFFNYPADGKLKLAKLPHTALVGKYNVHLDSEVNVKRVSCSRPGWYKMRAVNQFSSAVCSTQRLLLHDNRTHLVSGRIWGRRRTRVVCMQ